jgi:23S rRNA (uracil1939-C5)-methyltransferase
MRYGRAVRRARRQGRDEKHERIVVEATIDELAPGGDGVAIVSVAGERRAVFVRGTAVGDRVRAKVDLTKRPARGQLESVEVASPDRVEPPCAWASLCGGCDWMHVSPAAQLRAHEAHLAAALPAAWRGAKIGVHRAARALAYRTRARLHVRASGGRAIVGMNEAGTHDPVEVERCVVLDPALEAGRARVAALFEGAHGRGEVLIALGPFTQSPRRAVLDVHWSGELAGACFGRIERAVNEGWLAGARILAGEARVPARIGDASPWIRGGDGEPLRLADGGFGQASDEGNVALATRVAAIAAEACAGKDDAKVLELYAGAGNFTVLLARTLRHVVAVESSREACEAARANLAARGIDGGAKVVEADAATFAIPAGTRLVVLDPPRTGAREVATNLAASRVHHVVYVSCDPQTLARDLALLEPTFTLQSAELFELFPQTSHVESVVHLTRAARAGRAP